MNDPIKPGWGQSEPYDQEKEQFKPLRERYPQHFAAQGGGSHVSQEAFKQEQLLVGEEIGQAVRMVQMLQDSVSKRFSASIRRDDRLQVQIYALMVGLSLLCVLVILTIVLGL